MADAPSHAFGQFLGNLLEDLLAQELEDFCTKYGLYLDKHGKRPGVRTGSKVRWFDDFENAHDLDFVIEKNGTASRQGRPLAFIEVAWRRHSTHSAEKPAE